MRLKDNAELFAKRVHLLNRRDDEQILREFLELQEAKCIACQEDRLGCTIRPACWNRNILNLLIEIGVPSQDLPSFCYTQHLTQIRRFVVEQKGRSIEDRRVPIKDLLSALRLSSIRQFTTRFTKIWQKSSQIREGDIFLVLGDGLLFHFDFARGIVKINPWHHEFRDFAIFNLYVRVFMRFYNVEATASDTTINWWTLSLTIDSTDFKHVDHLFDSEIREKFDSFVLTQNKDNNPVVYVETIVDDSQSKLMVGDLRRLFALAAQAKKEAASNN